MKSSSSRSTAFSGLGSLFSLLLFLVFVLCALFTIMTGSRVYANIQDKDNAIFTRDTSVSYIKNKVRQADRAGQISVRDMEGVSSASLTGSFPRRTPYTKPIFMPGTGGSWSSLPPETAA